ncbi:putative oxidoreductase C-terminal domain-containing protein [Bacteroidota bacterium]
MLVPETYKIGHEAHFGQVTKKYLNFLVKAKLQILHHNQDTENG